jgi:AAHS family 4-hydroxybenzoate transporter-like MFS transporter
METPAQVNISEVIDDSRLGPFQLGICILCGLCLIMDGFDVQAMGYVAPAIIREWKIPNAELGPVFGAGLLGVLIGSLLFSMLADKIGRRPVLIGMTLFFSAMTFVTANAGSVRQMLAIRFIAGMGLGGIMPNAVALCGEYSSRAMRVTVMTIVGNGFTAGAAIGGFISAWLIPNFGWRSVFYFGAVMPLVIALAMFFWLPESLHFLVLHGKDPKNVDKWFRRVAPGAAVPSGAVQYVVAERKREGVPVFHLFRDGRAMGTVLLWIVNFMNLLNLYFLSSWLPTVVRDSGRSTSTAVLVGTAVQVGGTIAALGLGWFIERFGFVPVLATGFAVACVNIAMIGFPGLPLALLFAVVFLAGMGIVGGQAAVNALAGTYYPTSLRSTGIGWSLGIGRIGAIIGPVLAGELMALRWSNERLFLAAAVPALISAVVMLSMYPRDYPTRDLNLTRDPKPRRDETEPQPETEPRPCGSDHLI